MLSICLVAGRRPDLLKRTLGSFAEMLFDDNRIGSVRVNIDPIFGDKDDELACCEIVKQHFPDADIRTPEQPGFCAAVKWLWSGVPDGLILHLEDDWICLQKIDTAVVQDWMTTSVRSVQLLSENHGAKGHKEYSESRIRKKILGIKFGQGHVIPRFGTSPGFFDGKFMRNCARYLNEDLDPEKQMRPNINPMLFNQMESFRVKFYKSSTDGPIIVDIGRSWRDERKIDKIVTLDGRSLWVNQSSTKEG